MLQRSESSVVHAVDSNDDSPIHNKVHSTRVDTDSKSKKLIGGSSSRTTNHTADRKFKNIELIIDPFKAVRIGDANLLRKLLVENESLTKARWSGWSLLHRAAETGQTAICELLIVEFGADINARSVRGWHTPLHLSLANGHRETALLLVSVQYNLFYHS